MLLQNRPSAFRIRVLRLLFSGYLLIKSSFVTPRFDLSLDSRLEYLTLAVGNAKSHPVSGAGKVESAIAFLTDLEEKLDVAQVQLEIYHALQSYVSDPGDMGEKVRLLTKNLFTITEVCISHLPENRTH